MKHTKNFTIRDVIKTTHKEQIHQIVAEVTDAKPGHKHWLPHYPAALTQVVEGLSEADLHDAQNTLEEWNDKGCPREVQQM
jgi:hypothetical protein